MSGLVLGTVLSRHLGLRAFQNPNFKIVACNVHQDVAAGDRLFQFHTNPLFRFMPLTISYTVLEGCRALAELGGPDLTQQAKEFIQTSVELRGDKNVVGKYGGHSALTLEAASYYDDKATVVDYKTGDQEKHLWVCGHFVAKAFHPLLQDLEEGENDDYMLWMTKSAIQPRGTVDEWPKLLARGDAVRQWADEGKAESILRPGCVNTKDGTAADYRSLMTEI